MASSQTYRYQYYENRLDYYMHRRAKQRAESKGTPFDIEVSDVIIPEFCPVLGLELNRSSGKGKPANESPSLDRIVPELGYVKGNVQVVSHLANVMKNNATPDQLRRFASWVLTTYTEGE